MNHAIKITKSSQKATKGRRPKPLVKHMHQKGIKFIYNTSNIQSIQIQSSKVMGIRANLIGELDWNWVAPMRFPKQSLGFMWGRGDSVQLSSLQGLEAALSSLSGFSPGFVPRKPQSVLLLFLFLSVLFQWNSSIYSLILVA